MKRELPDRNARLLLVNTFFPALIVIFAMLALTPGIDREIIKTGNATLRTVTPLPAVTSMSRIR